MEREGRTSLAASPAGPSTEEVRAFWEAHPVADAAIAERRTDYDYFRAFDNLRESDDVEPFAFADHIHGFSRSSGQRILDYGCGNGYVLSQYARNGAGVVGVDLTDAALDLCRRRFALLGLEGSFLRTDGVTIPCDSDSFDVVCSMGVLHHVPEPTGIVAELRRVLRPGGTLIVMVYNRDSFRYRVTFPLRQRLGPPEVRGRPLQEIVNMNDGADCPWAQVYDRNELRRLLADFEAHRFEVSKLGVAELVQWRPLPLAVASRLVPGRAVAALARRAGWNLYCTAKKPGD